MPYSEELDFRIQKILEKKNILFEAKKMMGGICYLVDGKMLSGIVKDKLMARIDPCIYEDALSKKGCAEMDFTGRSMKGYVFVEEEGIESDLDLCNWLQLCLDYNPNVKASKKQKK